MVLLDLLRLIILTYIRGASAAVGVGLGLRIRDELPSQPGVLLKHLPIRVRRLTANDRSAFKFRTGVGILFTGQS